MGIYIFTWEKLRKYLISDEENKDSENDFGKNIIPEMLKNNENLFAFNFNGYWKDVGTIKSLWEANMDLLDEDSLINSLPNWKIYSRNRAETPHYIGGSAKLTNSLITEGCVIDGTIINSVISSGVVVEKGAVIKNSYIMPNVHIGAHAKVNYAIVGTNAFISDNAEVGKNNSSDIVLIDPNKTIGGGVNNE
jgi:glucose-1-phosphate adenylyltransferase